MSLRLDVPVSFGWHTPYFVAIDKGWYAEEGIEVEVLEGQGSANTVRLVGTGANTFGAAVADTMAQGIAQGVPIKAIAAIMSKSPHSILFRADSGITKPKDMEGKALGYTPGSAPELLWPAFAQAAGIDVKKVRIVTVDLGAKLTMLLRKDVETVVTMNLIVPSLELRGKDQNVKINSFLFVDYGFNLVGFNLMTSDQVIRDKPNVVRAFVGASLRGLKWAFDNPTQAVEIHMRYRPKPSATLVEEIKVVQSLAFSKRTQGKPLGWQDREDWQESLDVLRRYNLLKDKVTVEECFTNEFLPRA